MLARLLPALRSSIRLSRAAPVPHPRPWLATAPRSRNALLEGLLLGSLVLPACGTRTPPGSPAATPTPSPAPVPILEASVPRPLPVELAALDEEIQELGAAGRAVELARAYPKLMAGLRAAWGEGSPDLIPYHAGYCAALSRAGEAAAALQEAAGALALWPTSSPHLLLAARLRMERGRLTGKLPPGTRDALTILLDPRNRPVLAALHADPAALAIEWASLLLATDQAAEALAVLDRTIAGDPRARPPREARARTLIQAHRAKEALPLLRELVAEEAEPRVQALLGEALLDTGDVSEAWALLEKLPRAPGGSLELPVARQVRLHGARALHRLGRGGEARDRLLEQLLEEPEDHQALQQLIAVLRGAGKTDTAGALERRAADLAPYRQARAKLLEARRAERIATSRYLEAASLLVLDRCGSALQALEAARQADPGFEDPWLLEYEVRLRLGRLRPAIAAAEAASTRTRSPLVGLALARLLARAGRSREALELVEETRRATAPEPHREALLQAGRIRVLRELGEDQELPALAAAADSGSARPAPLFVELPELLILGRAERLLAQGDKREARAVLSQRFRSFPGAEVWASALRTQAEDARALTDPSDLVDHPELLRAPAVPEDAMTPRLREILERARGLAADRQRLTAKMGGAPDAAALPVWRELIAGYLARGAARKARGGGARPRPVARGPGAPVPPGRGAGGPRQRPLIRAPFVERFHPRSRPWPVTGTRCGGGERIPLRRAVAAQRGA